jgi:uncharacterized protein (UPF0276 family)
MDIEGGEYMALRGALELITCTRPIIFLEWNELNLKAYGMTSHELVQLAERIGYAIHAIPSLATVGSPEMLKLAMAQTESFVMVPLEAAVGEALSFREGLFEGERTP